MPKSTTEEAVRRDLAAAYRLAAMAGWDDSIHSHLSAAVPHEKGCYLINEFGLTFDEVCASNLVKVNLAGDVIDGSGRSVNPTGFAIHAAVHEARKDVVCVIHLHAPWTVALSMIPDGLLPVSQWALRFQGRLGRHSYEGLALGAIEQKRLVGNLGQLDGLILNNHGALVVGQTVAEAYTLMYLLERAAQAQLRAMAAAGGHLSLLGNDIIQRAQSQWMGDGAERDGDAEWPAWLRRVERHFPDYKN